VLKGRKLTFRQELGDAKTCRLHFTQNQKKIADISHSQRLTGNKKIGSGWYELTITQLPARCSKPQRGLSGAQQAGMG
jgi:hypothetical protein